MKKLIKYTLAASAVMSCFAANAGEIKGLSSPNVIANRYIVVFKDNAMMSARGVQQTSEMVAKGIGNRFGAKVERSFKHVLNGAVITTDVANAKRMADDPEVAYVEADQIMRINATQTGATWGLDRLDQASLPLNQSFTYPSSSGVHAYILDTGIRATHNDFTGRMGNGHTSINDGQGTNDCQGHGTHVAGTVGGTTWGVAKNVTLRGSFSHNWPMWERVLRLLESGKLDLKPVLGGVFPIKDWQVAFEKMQSGEILKSVIRPE